MEKKKINQQLFQHRLKIEELWGKKESMVHP